MSITRWLRNLRSIGRSPENGRHKPALRFRPLLEALENRWLPSTLTVTSLLDDGSGGTLRATIADAHNNDTIVFDPGLSGGTVVLNGQELLLDKHLTIAGPSDSVTISGNDVSRVFEVAAKVRVTLTDLAIVDGHQQSDFGSGVLNFGKLALNSCTLSHNVHAGYGGGIANFGTMTVSGCTLSANTASSGGGIYNAGIATISSSILSGNVGQQGGGINNRSSMTIISSTLTGNVAQSSGGAIANIGSNLGATVTVQDSTLTGNSAKTEGGAIFNYQG